MKFKVDDKVRIKSDLIVGRNYGNETFVDKMEKYKGQVGIIKNISINGSGIKYNLLINDCPESLEWAWSDEMLEPYKETRLKSASIIIKDKEIKVFLKGSISCNGSSTWNNKDKYDEKIGILIATARALGFDKETVQGFINVIFKEDDKKKEEPKKESINKEDKSNCHCGKDKCEKVKTCNTKNSEETNKKDIPKKKPSKSVNDELMEFLFTLGLLKELF